MLCESDTKPLRQVAGYVDIKKSTDFSIEKKAQMPLDCVVLISRLRLEKILFLTKKNAAKFMINVLFSISKLS